MLDENLGCRLLAPQSKTLLAWIKASQLLMEVLLWILGHHAIPTTSKAA
jgi:hypothetical protein